jgi:predicted 3-demethylubiquinone-9 3-methyltransferase (glyoxalase superfamily)
MENAGKSIVPFLTFPGNAEEAINFYVASFTGAIPEKRARFSMACSN